MPSIAHLLRSYKALGVISAMSIQNTNSQPDVSSMAAASDVSQLSPVSAEESLNTEATLSLSSPPDGSYLATFGTSDSVVNGLIDDGTHLSEF